MQIQLFFTLYIQSFQQIRPLGNIKDIGEIAPKHLPLAQCVLMNYLKSYEKDLPSSSFLSDQDAYIYTSVLFIISSSLLLNYLTQLKFYYMSTF